MRVAHCGTTVDVAQALHPGFEWNAELILCRGIAMPESVQSDLALRIRIP